MLIEEYEANEKLKDEMIKKKDDLDVEYKEALEVNKRLSEELVEENLRIQTIKEKLDDLLKNDEDGNEIGTQELMEECEYAIKKFLIALPKGKNIPKNLPFKVEYLGKKYDCKVEDDSMDFLTLKTQIKSFLGKQEKEIYFVDENGYVFLDELNVKNALFPLSNVYLSDFMPVITALDNYILSDNSKEVKKEMNPYADVKIEKKPVENKPVNNKLFPFESFWRSFRTKLFDLIQISVFIIFLAFWIRVNINFRHSDKFKSMMRPFEKNKFFYYNDKVKYFLIIYFHLIFLA